MGPEIVPGGEDVAGLEVAAVAGVVGDELGWGPVEVLGVGTADTGCVEIIFAHGCS